MHEFTHIFLKISVSINLLSALFNVINDCDETYNYWEPLHFLSTNGKGGGFQTWEYSPEYSLRSYLYLWIFGWPAFLFRYFQFPGWFAFFAVRIYLGVLSAVQTTFLAVSLTSLEIKYKTLFALIFLTLYNLTPGNFLTSTTLLPSGPCAGLVSMMLGSWIKRNYFCAVGCVAFMGIIVWPFAAAIGIPLFLHIVFLGKFLLLIKYSFIWMLILIPPLVYVDSLYFGQFTLAPLNIIMYNIFSNGIMGKSSSQLYGTEPISFYLKNYFINHNISSLTSSALVFIFAPFTVLKHLYFDKSYKSKHNDSVSFISLLMMVFSCLITWNGVFFIQAHKEERFLFPCYPCIALASALFIWIILDIVLKISNGKRSHIFLSAMIILFLGVFSIMSISRTVHMVRWYSSPAYLVKHLPNNNNKTVFCLGRDWHLFPSRFLIPGDPSLWTVRFLLSNFSGQLPGQFILAQKSVFESTRVNGSLFNEFNIEELDRFSPNGASDCDYILDRDSSVGLREELYVADKLNWKSILNHSILDQRMYQLDEVKSFIEKVLYHFSKSYYIPFLFKPRSTLIHMHLLRRLNSEHSNT